MEKRAKESKFKTIKKRIRIRTILFLALALSCNSFAWFVYTSKVSNSITANVKAWRVEFESQENEAIEYIDFNIDSIYPGMEEYNNSITVTNQGESDAKIIYEIVYMNILGTEYKDEKYSSTEMLEILKANYPFQIDLSVSNTIIAAKTGKEYFRVKVSWSFESGNDELDTYWGNLAYHFKEKNPDLPGISLKIKLSASQLN